ncbi:Hypothetical predicted protein [Pelobates cultripes]|uniref:Ubiquitin-like protease family profile domain-containing protein n=1 Tax=Pelobates cultripes TaxID=61616 RepID=A0AAD1WIQ4_PELCU|nr:Hypothetical predicted protein [Pelobates cultripes]
MYKPDEQPDQWKTWIMYHNNQQDSTSCGVLILMFAKEFLWTRTISEVKISPEYIRDARLEIACALLQYKDTVGVPSGLFDNSELWDTRKMKGSMFATHEEAPS